MQVAARNGSQQEDSSNAPHVNAIVELHVFPSASGQPTQRFSTAAWDGRVVVWDASHVGDLIGALHSA